MTDPGVYGPIKTVCGSDYYVGKTKVIYKLKFSEHETILYAEDLAIL